LSTSKGSLSWSALRARLSGFDGESLAVTRMT
jgi:hypothetical protein